MFNKLRRYWKVLKYIYNQGAEGLDASIAMYQRIEKERYRLYGNNTIHNSTIGRQSYVAHNSLVYSTDIGNYCSIGPNAVIGYGDHPTDKFSTNPLVYYNEQLYSKEQVAANQEKYNKRVTIKNDVWIGGNVLIRNGVTIGNGAVIGAGAVLMIDVPDYAIAVGAPARIIRKRLDDATIEKIKATNWWDYDIEALIAKKDEPEIQVLLKIGSDLA